MKVGISFGSFSSSYRLPIDLIVKAETLGFDSVWTAETYGSDALTPLAFIAARTERMKLGTTIAQLAARPPANFAMCAQTIDALAGGDRMIVGLGVSNPQIVEGWYGQPWGRPYHRLKDYVAIMRQIFRREGPVAHRGEEISLPYTGDGATGLGKPLKSILKATPDLPIFLGTDANRNVTLAGEIADGWICMNWAPGKGQAYLDLIAQGLAKRTDGRRLADFAIQAVVEVRVCDDVAEAMASVREHVALTVGGMGAKEKNFHKDKMIRRGFGDAAERIQELYLGGYKEEARNAVPDDYIDEGALIGPPARIRERWQRWPDSGLTRLTVRNPDVAAVELIGSLIDDGKRGAR